jgi:MoaA/NifB/PqqE/SkfB family radical SAM enzyme
MRMLVWYSMVRCNPWEYTDLSDVKAGSLAYLTIACTTRCNFHCPYCSKKDFAIQDLDFALLKKWLDEAIGLGLRKVELTGGEAIMHPDFWELIDFLHGNDIEIMLVTNGSRISKTVALGLFQRKVNVAISLSTLDERNFNALSGTSGELVNVLRSLENLKDTGYSAYNKPMVAIHSLGSSGTLYELPALRYFAENNGIGFVLNRAIPVGGLDAKNVPAPGELKDFLDGECEAGSVATIPFFGDIPCNRLKAGCYIGSDARVRPCSSIDICAGDLNSESLADIWNKSIELSVCRSIETKLEGSCGKCPENIRCYGCRAAAYAVWGSLTAPDPGCFRYDSRYNI